jgi:DNA-binding GntR family transcriptional regulator
VAAAYRDGSPTTKGVIVADTTDSNANPQPLIQRRNLGDDVYRILWSRIISRDLHPGEKLSDLKLSAELGVSRTPVREALHRLLQDGVIRAQPNRGFFVTSFNARDIDEIFEIRAALESLALRTVVSRHPDEDYSWAVEQLDEVDRLVANARTEAEIVRANERFLEVDQGFHKYIVEHAGNERLTAMINGIWAQIAVFQKAGTHVPGYTEVALRQHREIITLLRDKRYDAAIEALQAHIRDMKQRIIVDMAEQAAAEEQA